MYQFQDPLLNEFTWTQILLPCTSLHKFVSLDYFVNGVSFAFDTIIHNMYILYFNVQIAINPFKTKIRIKLVTSLGVVMWVLQYPRLYTFFIKYECILLHKQKDFD